MSGGPCFHEEPADDRGEHTTRIPMMANMCSCAGGQLIIAGAAVGGYFKDPQELDCQPCSARHMPIRQRDGYDAAARILTVCQLDRAAVGFGDLLRQH